MPQVEKFKDGSIVGQSQNSPEWGYIRLTETRMSIANNWMRTENLSTLIRGKYEELKVANLTHGTTFPGKLVIRESLDPFNPGPYQDLDLKRAFKDGPLLVVEDEPIYRATVHTYNMEEQDVLLTHTNVQEVKDAIAARKLEDVKETPAVSAIEALAEVEIKSAAEVDSPF